MTTTGVRLKPGLDVELTPTYDEAGYEEFENGRFRAGMFEKLGGWQKYYPLRIGGTPRAGHAWQDLNEVDRLAVGTTTQMVTIADGVLQDISPQELLTNTAVNFQTTSADATVEITDTNISNVTSEDAVEFLTPIAVGGLILSGIYPIATRTGTTSYTIEARANATATRANADITGITQANPAVVTYSGADNWANGDLVFISGVVGMMEVNNQIYVVANVNTGANTFELQGVDSSAFTAYSSGGVASPAQVPEFTTTTDSAVITVRLADHAQAVGNTVVFPVSTSVGGLAIQGKYTVLSTPSVDSFTISATSAASSSATALMNAGQVAFRYHIALAPGVAGLGYGLGFYGLGAYGVGGGAGSDQTGTPIAATNYTLDNWGELLLANPENGGLYYWGPASGLKNLKLVVEAPTKAAAMFVSQSAQQVFMLGASVNAWDPVNQASGVPGIGIYRDPLLVQWCDIGNFFTWDADAANLARNFRIPTGSKLIGGGATKNRNLIWTDLQLWSFTFVNLPDVYAANQIGDECGLIGPHAWTRFADGVAWMGQKNIFRYAGAGVQPMECPVWDDIFQDLSETYKHLSVAASNADFTELWFFYTSASGGLSYPDKYIKYNVLDSGGVWDAGPIGRAAWVPRSVLGNPIGITGDGLIYSHESGYNDDGQPLRPRFLTTWFSFEEAQDFIVVDRITPDFKWGVRGGAEDAQIQLTIYGVETPGETPITRGPYLVTKATQYVDLDPPLRAKQLALEVKSDDLDSFWRLGLVRFRWRQDGRR